jgi:uncharacterized protein (TIGR02246 family)
MRPAFEPKAINRLNPAASIPELWRWLQNFGGTVKERNPRIIVETCGRFRVPTLRPNKRTIEMPGKLLFPGISIRVKPMKRSSLLLIAIALFSQLAMAQTKASYNDKEAIKLIALSFQDAWNRHDMKALSELVAEDVDFINVAGVWLKNRKEFEKHHARAHEAQFNQSVLTFKDVHIKLSVPKMAVVHIEWDLKGDKDEDGTPRQSRQGIFTWVLENQDGKWLIITAHNTNARSSPR